MSARPLPVTEAASETLDLLKQILASQNRQVELLEQIARNTEPALSVLGGSPVVVCGVSSPLAGHQIVPMSANPPAIDGWVLR